MKKKKIEDNELEEFSLDLSRHKKITLSSSAKKEIKESSKSRKTIGVLSLFISISFTILFIIQKYNNSILDNKGIETTAIVEHITLNDYRSNDMDGKWVYTYVIKYSFLTEDNNQISSYYEIQGKEYKRYFEKKIKINDTISIIYLPEKPEKNKIKRISTFNNQSQENP